MPKVMQTTGQPMTFVWPRGILWDGAGPSLKPHSKIAMTDAFVLSTIGCQICRTSHRSILVSRLLQCKQWMRLVRRYRAKFFSIHLFAFVRRRTPHCLYWKAFCCQWAPRSMWTSIWLRAGSTRAYFAYCWDGELSACWSSFRRTYRWKC